MKRLKLILACLIIPSFLYAQEVKEEVYKEKDLVYIIQSENSNLVLEKRELYEENKVAEDPTENSKDYYLSTILWGTPKNDKVETFINYFKTKIRDRFSVWLSRSSKYLPIINKIFEEHGIANELVFLPLIESGFSPYATSRAQAVGIWQFIKGTAIRYGLRVDNFVDERKDPVKSTEAAAKYLKDLYEMFGSWDLALAAYNAGEGKISKIINLKGTNNFWDVIAHKKVKRETKEYVPRFVAATLIAKEPELYGFEDINYHPTLDFEEVVLPPKTTLSSVADIIGVDEELLREYNPAIKYGILPPDTPYVVRVPKGTSQILIENMAMLKQADEKIIKKILAKKEKKHKKYVRKQKKREFRKVANVKRNHFPL